MLYHKRIASGTTASEGLGSLIPGCCSEAAQSESKSWCRQGGELHATGKSRPYHVYRSTSHWLFLGVRAEGSQAATLAVDGATLWWPAGDNDMAGDACSLLSSTSGAASHDDDIIKTPRYLIQTSSRLPYRTMDVGYGYGSSRVAR